MANTLDQTIKGNGINQGDLVKYLENVRDVTNELQTDHATLRTVIGDLKTLLNNVRTWTQAYPLGNPGFAIATNFDVQNANAFDYSIAGVLYTEAATQTFDTGTTATFAAGTWAVALLSINAAGTETVTWDDNSNAGYASEALAIAALPATPANHCPLGYITVQANAGATFTAGTDALTTGTGGNVAQATNYYNMSDAKGTISAAVTTSAPAALTNSTALTLSKG